MTGSESTQDRTALLARAAECSTPEQLGGLANDLSSTVAHLRVTLARAASSALLDPDEAQQATNFLKTFGLLNGTPTAGPGAPSVGNWQVRQAAAHALQLADALDKALYNLQYAATVGLDLHAKGQTADQA